ncbi:DUF438 domain-containing protein [Planctomycetota bacterium]
MTKAEQLMCYLIRLDGGENPALVKEEAREFLKNIDAHDLTIAEQNLMEKGLIIDDLQRLCEMHLELIEDQVLKMKPNLPSDHVILTMLSEHESILCFLDELDFINRQIQDMENFDADCDVFVKLKKVAEHLSAAERHHEREEDILFSELERRGLFAPLMIIKQEHATQRGYTHQLKALTEDVEEMKLSKFKLQLDAVVRFLAPTLREHILKENNILYPTALAVIKDEKVWLKLKQACDKIGNYCFTQQKLK